MDQKIYDVVIIGSGPSGLTAAIYTTRADLSTLVIAGLKWGGQLMLTTLVENYPGFPEGIMGPQLMMDMRKQAEHFGAEFVNVDVKSINASEKSVEITTADDKTFHAKTVIIATGADTKWLNVPGEQERIGRGVASCAPCDAAFYRGKKVIVVGGGDSAMEEASVLTRFAEHVWLVHRRDEFRASAAMQKRVFDNEKITVVWNSAITEVFGDQKVEKVKIKTIGGLKIRENNKESEKSPEELGGKQLNAGSQELTWEFPVDGVFVAIGHIPNSMVFTGVETDDKGFIKVHEQMKTNLPNVYVSGDVHDHVYQQAVTAAGYGCMAALEVERYLRSQEETS